MKKPVSRVLIINDEPLVLKEFVKGLNAAARSLDNPLGITFSGVTTAREALAAIEEVSSIVDANTDASTLRAMALLAMDEGDRAGAASAVERLLQFVHAGNRPNAVARSTWFGARLLGADAVGGEDAVRRARDRLEAIGWRTWLEEDLRLPSP